MAKAIRNGKKTSTDKLYEAIQNNDSDSVKSLIRDEEIDANHAFRAAAINGKLDIVKGLIDDEEFNIDFNEKDSVGLTIVEETAFHGRTDVINYIIENIPEEEKNRAMEGAILFAAKAGHTDIIENLDENEIDLMPALSDAIDNRQIETAKYLIDKGTTIDEDIAAAYKVLVNHREDIHDFSDLEKFGADPKALDAYISPRQSAAANLNLLKARAETYFNTMNEIQSYEKEIEEPKENNVEKDNIIESEL